MLGLDRKGAEVFLILLIFLFFHRVFTVFVKCF